MATRMQQRRGTASQWTTANPVLNAGEIGWESDTNKLKIGDGTNTWSSLDYFIDETALDTTLGDYVETADLAVANGVATLDGNGKLTSTQLPDLGEITADEMNDVLVGGTGVTKVYDDPNSTITLSIGQAVATTDNVTFGTVTANLTGNVTGNVTGDVTGNVSGNAGTVTNGVYTTGSTMTGYLTLHADPSNALQAATKQYVDAVAEGLHIHPSAVAATTANITLATGVENGDVLDGVTLATGNRILVKNQTTQSENGIYVVAASGAPSRATDFDAPAEIDGGDFVFVTGGTVNDNTGWVQTNTVGTIGTDPIAFSQFSGAGTYTAGNGLTLTGSAFSIDTAITADLSTSQTFTNKTLTSPTITTPTLTLSTSSSTTEGVIAWDSTLDKILVGDGSTAREFASSTLKTSAQTASYTLVLADKDKVVEMNVASANNLTVPLNSSVAYPVGTQINLVQTGAGQTTVVATVGVTINTATTLKLRTQWSTATLIKRNTDTWVLLGDLATS
jgi:hypothetical protein